MRGFSRNGKGTRHSVLGWKGRLGLGVALIQAVMPVVAGDTQTFFYYREKERGWFWKEPIPEPTIEEPSPEPAKTDAEASPESPDVPEKKTTALRPLSPAWLREQLPLLRDRAIENPTSENIRDYFKMQQYAMNLAERFAAGAQQVVLGDPTLDENTRRPLSTYGAQVVDMVAREETERVAAHIASFAGLWYFFRSDCPYCRAENPVLERLQKRLSLVVLPISLDGQAMPEGHFAQFVPDKGHAQRLGVSKTPTLYLVQPGHGFALVSEGLVTDQELVDRMVIAAHTAGWITDEEFNATRPRGPILTAGSSSPAIAEDDASDLLSLLSSMGGGAGSL